MKTFTLICLAVFAVSFSTYSQSQKSDLKASVSVLPLLGSSGSFGNGALGIVVKPAVGYHISDRTSLDVNFSYSTLDGFQIDEANSHYNSYSFIPTLRYHAFNKSKFRVFVEGGFGLGIIKYSADNEAQESANFDRFNGGISILNLGVGANYYFNPSFGLEIILPYINSRNITSDSVNTVYEGIGPTLGVTFKVN